jgi:toxin ParE1/3/4
MSLFWSPKASAARRAAIEYSARDNPVAALDLLDKIVRQTQLLAVEPEMGRLGRVPGTRELVVNGTPFIAICRIKGERIEILCFLHGAQQWPS